MKPAGRPVSHPEDDPKETIPTWNKKIITNIAIINNTFILFFNKFKIWDSRVFSTNLGPLVTSGLGTSLLDQGATRVTLVKAIQSTFHFENVS